MLKLLLIFLLSSTTIYGSVTSCNIYIHGIGTKPVFNDKKFAIKWDSSLRLEDGAYELAEKLLEQTAECEDELPVMLHAHNYAATVLFYILGQGKRFSSFFPDHSFVQLYKKVTAVYSYAGVYRGTPLMDLICSSGEFGEISEVLGDKCILAMSSSSIHHPSNVVTNPGVPFFLVYSTNSQRLFGDFLDRYRFGPNVGRKNLNDGVVMLSSSKACKDSVDMFTDSDCEKINSSYFKDHLHIKNRGHFELTREVPYGL